MPRPIPLINFDDFYESTNDMSKDYMPMECGYNTDFNYECTVTFDQKKHTKASAFHAQYSIVRYLTSWVPKIKDLIVVIEYQKNGMPHYHINIGTDTLIKDAIPNQVIQGFQRFYGMTTFRPVIDLQAFNTYLLKDVISNNQKKPIIPHYTYYSIINEDDYYN